MVAHLSDGEDGLSCRNKINSVIDIANAVDGVESMGADTAAGDTAATNIPITGIVTTDTLKMVIGWDLAGNTVTDFTANSSITSDGNIQCSDDTTGFFLLVLWNGAGGGSGGTSRVFHDISTSGTPADVNGDDLTGDDWYRITTGGTKGTETINLNNVTGGGDPAKQGFKVTFEIVTMTNGFDKPKMNYDDNLSSNIGALLLPTARAWIEFTCNGEGFSITNSSTWDASGHGPNGAGAPGTYSHTEGNNCRAGGNYAHAEGTETVAGNQAAHAEGGNTTASGQTSHAEGQTTVASAINSHAEGISTTASGDNSHAEGSSTLAQGDTSHAEGDNCIADGDASQASGQQAWVNGVKTRQAYSSGRFIGNGDVTDGYAQGSRLCLRGTTVDDVTIALCTDASASPNAPNSMTLLDYDTMVITGQIVGRDILALESSVWKFEAVAKRGNGPATVALIGAPTITLIAQDAGASDFVAPTISTDAGAGSFSIQAEGTAGRTTRWLARIDSAEIMGRFS